MNWMTFGRILWLHISFFPAGRKRRDSRNTRSEGDASASNLIWKHSAAHFSTLLSLCFQRPLALALQVCLQSVYFDQFHHFSQQNFAQTLFILKSVTIFTSHTRKICNPKCPVHIMTIFCVHSVVAAVSSSSGVASCNAWLAKKPHSLYEKRYWQYFMAFAKPRYA